MDLKNNFINKYKNDYDDYSSNSDDAEMYENDKKFDSLKTLEELLHQELLENYKPKYQYDDYNDDKNIFPNYNERNEKNKLKNTLKDRYKSII